MKSLRGYYIRIATIIPVSLVLSYITIFYPMPRLQSNIFESLIQVIVIFSSFIIVILLYYMTRLDTLKKEYIPCIDIMAKKYMNLLLKRITLIGEQVKLLRVAYDSPEKWAEIDNIIKEINTLVKKGELYESGTDKIIKRFELQHKFLIKSMNYMLISFSFSLVLCFVALFLSTYKPSTNLWSFLIFSVMSMYFTIYSFQLARAMVSDFAEELERDYLINPIDI